ncbi:unnamed protein product [Notodromas monacha]|uniref:Uncharacterized protein n=1 Tax=Notodromas monacha TaxID=399045 RepID=A0A7R9BGU2_9CRUS|nr:unnamed protein product [Notodromas monacha]CAG0913615.1 unnamed protein product [Notodromas monacha]
MSVPKYEEKKAELRVIAFYPSLKPRNILKLKREVFIVAVPQRKKTRSIDNRDLKLSDKMIVTQGDGKVGWSECLSTDAKSPAEIFNIDPNLNWSFHTSTENIKLPFVDDPDDEHDNGLSYVADDCDCRCDSQDRESSSTSRSSPEGECLEGSVDEKVCAVSLLEKEIRVAVDATEPNQQCECPSVDLDPPAKTSDEQHSFGGRKPPVAQEGFFRRSIQQKIQYRPCTKNQQCSILRINRNRCQYCRLKKCIAVGMSRDETQDNIEREFVWSFLAVRFGRVPKREKAKILAAMQSVAWKSQEKAIDAALAADDSSLMSTVTGAHRDTCPFTQDRLPTFLMRAHEQAHLHPNTSAPNGQMRFSPAIRGVVEFAKRLPGFSMLVQEDQVTLLKAGVFEVLLLRLAGLFDSQTNTMVSLNGMVVKRESFGGPGPNGGVFGNARFLMDSMFDFADRLNTLQLSDAELALFSAIVILSPDRPGLRNPELVDRICSKMTSLLKQSLRQRRKIPNFASNNGEKCESEHISEEEALQMYDDLVKKIPDLRTLNTLHSEKLLAFKMTEQQQQQCQTDAEPETDVDMKSGIPESYSRGGCPNEGNDLAEPPMRGKGWEQFEHQGLSSNSSTSSGHCSGSSGCASPRSPHSLISEEGVKSPVGSLCSNESAYSGDCHSVLTMSSGISRLSCPRTSESGHLPPQQTQQHDPRGILPQCHGMTAALGMCMNGEAQAPSSTIAHAENVETMLYVPRKLDSPTDSGIESGCEAARLGGKLSPSRPASACNSPQCGGRVSQEELSAGGESSPEDMPVLKRALQAPPLITTNLLMDEAYRPHKKFRAMRREQEGDATSSTSSSSPGPSAIKMDLLRSALTPEHGSSEDQHSAPGHQQRLPSTLARSLMEAPKMTAEQMKQTDMLASLIMRGDMPQPYRPSYGARPSTSKAEHESAADSGGYRHSQFHASGSSGGSRTMSALTSCLTASTPIGSPQASTSHAYGYHPPSPIQPPIHVHPRLVGGNSGSHPPSPSPDSPSDSSAALHPSGCWKTAAPMERTSRCLPIDVDPNPDFLAEEAPDAVAPLNLSKKILAIPVHAPALAIRAKMEV